jgi:hypothetical protein
VSKEVGRDDKEWERRNERERERRKNSELVGLKKRASRDKDVSLERERG